MTPPRDTTSWEYLQANADRPEVQELIRREIRLGTIRVRPAPDGGIQILPVFKKAVLDRIRA